MFKDKGGENIENKLVAKIKITNVSINIVDVHVATLIQICFFYFYYLLSLVSF
jgi:hypothetical protein